MTYYDLLGISRTAKDIEIKKAYHQMIIAFHPDNYKGDKRFAAEKSHAIIEAYRVLSNPAARKKYDETLIIQELNAMNRLNINTVSPSRSSYNRADKHQYAGILKTALIIAGILFVVFSAVFFIMVLTNASM